MTNSTCNLNLKQDPLEAVLVIFGRSLIFFCLKGLGKLWKNDTTFVRMRSSDHLGDAKMWKKAPRFVNFNFFTNRNRRKRFPQNERRRAYLQKNASDFLILPRDEIMIFQSLVMILPHFSTLKDHN